MTNQLMDMKHADVILVEGGNPAENHPASFKHISEAKRRGAKLITIDPRFSRTAAMSDMWLAIRPGTDIAMISGFIKYLIDNERYDKEYLAYFTNASFLINKDFDFKDGVYSGLTEIEPTNGNGGRTFKYDKSSWAYELVGDNAESSGDGTAGMSNTITNEQKKPTGNNTLSSGIQIENLNLPAKREFVKDETLEHPRCVFQLLKKHVERFTPEMVEKITGVSQEQFLKAADIVTSTYSADKAGGFMYAMGLCHHTVGAQSIRAACIMQTLLHNIGVPGGGMNAMRGECNVQGATDFALLAGELPGYTKLPNTSRGENSLGEYLSKHTADNGYYMNRPKFIISMLKEWYGEHATLENDFGFDWWPKDDKKDHTHISIFEWMMQGNLEGFFAWGQNPVIGGPNSNFTLKALSKLKWMVNVDLWYTDTATWWKHVPDTPPEEVMTEVFVLPACNHFEKQGSITNTGRNIQWRYKAVDPLSGAHDDGDMLVELWCNLRDLYKAHGGVCPEPLVNLELDKFIDNSGKFSPIKAAWGINGYEVESGRLLQGFGELKDDGSTACGNWIYSGYFCNNDDKWNPAAQPTGSRGTRDIVVPGGDGDGLGIYPDWTFSWPLNRRILYNRASCDPSGKPYNPGRQLVEWDEANQKWIQYDVADFPVNKKPDETWPFMMTDETVARLFSPTMADGPFPEHYEAIECPIPNMASSQHSNPIALVYKGSSKTDAQTVEKYPLISSDFHLVEHWQTGSETRNQPWLAQIMPRFFCEIPTELAEERGIENGDMVEVFNERGSIKMNVVVTKRIKPYVLDGKSYYTVSMPFHWGWSADVIKGDVRNMVTPHYGDGNSSTPEFKTFLCDIRKVGE